MDALFHTALADHPRSGHLIGLDLGCADGTVTADRFSPSLFTGVIGVDVEQQVVERARQLHPDDHLRFEQLDIEGVDAYSRLRQLLADQGAPGFDLVFAGLSLHHLANPILVLRTVRYLLNPGGVVVVRSTDDGLKVAYPDADGRVASMIETTLRQPGVSDRHHGRKLYHQLYRAGFRDIAVHVHPTTTVALSTPERHALFVESFSYRRNYLVRLLEQAPDRADLRQELATVDATLQELELDFEDDGFFYLEFDVAAVARVVGAGPDR